MKNIPGSLVVSPIGTIFIAISVSGIIGMRLFGSRYSAVSVMRIDEMNIALAATGVVAAALARALKLIEDRISKLESEISQNRK